jgi:F0F1-type ATP synthase membrane subunit b/b'
MIRLLLSIIILTLLITYAIIPFMKYIQKFFSKEAKRIDSALTNNEEKDEVK